MLHLRVKFNVQRWWLLRIHRIALLLRKKARYCELNSVIVSIMEFLHVNFNLQSVNSFQHLKISFANLLAFLNNLICEIFNSLSFINFTSSVWAWNMLEKFTSCCWLSSSINRNAPETSECLMRFLFIIITFFSSSSLLFRHSLQKKKTHNFFFIIIFFSVFVACLSCFMWGEKRMFHYDCKLI